jgi:tetratricopeptide (TPR) repeat protein
MRHWKPYGITSAPSNWSPWSREALRHYERAIELEPMEPRPYHWRGMMYNTMGYGDRCLADLERALELDPQNPNVHFALASCLLVSADWDRAVEIASHGATLGNPGGYGLAIRARHQQGDIEGALGHLVYAQEELGFDDEVTDELTDEQIETLGLGVAVFLENPEPALQLLAASAPGDINQSTLGGLFGAGYQAIQSDPRFIDYLDRSGPACRLPGSKRDVYLRGGIRRCGNQ